MSLLVKETPNKQDWMEYSKCTAQLDSRKNPKAYMAEENTEKLYKYMK